MNVAGGGKMHKFTTKGTTGVSLVRTLWGMPDANHEQHWNSMFARMSLREGGGAIGMSLCQFEGVEVCSPGPFFPFRGHEQRMNDLLELNNLSLVMQVQTCDYPVVSSDWKVHADSLRAKCEESVKKFNPVMINVHGGKDSFSLDDSLKFFEAAVQVEKDIGVKVVHETHRQRSIHSPFVLRDLLKAGLPKEIKLNADLSHFVLVCERLFDDKIDADFWPPLLEEIAERCHYIHGRVGFSQGIQVNDPFAPEHRDAVAMHMRWWRTIVEKMRERSAKEEGKNDPAGLGPVAICPEFGPYPYLPHFPHTMEPTANLGVVVEKFGRVLREQLDIDDS